jgi:hypothetical protein
LLELGKEKQKTKKTAKSNYGTGLEERCLGSWNQKPPRNRQRTGRDQRREKPSLERERGYLDNGREKMGK